MKQNRALHNKPDKTGQKGYRGKKERVGGGERKASCRRKTEPLEPISWTFETLSAGKGREEEEEY
jgi:hypothetical protein